MPGDGADTGLSGSSVHLGIAAVLKSTPIVDVLAGSEGCWTRTLNVTFFLTHKKACHNGRPVALPVQRAGEQCWGYVCPGSLAVSAARSACLLTAASARPPKIKTTPAPNSMPS